MTARRIALILATALAGTACSALGFQGNCNGTEIIGIFAEVGDLVENANVQSSDVEIGSVTNIELDGWNARVTMCLDEGEGVPEDTEAVIRTTSLLGEKFVDIQSESGGPPFLPDGATLDLDQTSKATELEEVFAKLAAVLGTGNLEQINRFTASQAEILEGRSDELRDVLSRLRRFTDVLNGRRNQIAASVDSLDSVARTVLNDSTVLERFLDSFAGSSRVLSEQRQELENLLVALDRFTNVSVRLLDATERGLDEQFRDLRPVLDTAVANSTNLRASLRTLATFTQMFPETMPGDYLQLDVCQAPPEETGQGTTCPQSIRNDDPTRAGTGGSFDGSSNSYRNAVEYLLRVDVTRGSR
ncbi:MAG: MCE family protein [Actinomycetota bacterium]|nr:MCE family protein [Actinomycetota bacterium]